MLFNKKSEEVKKIIELNKPHDGNHEANFIDKTNIIELIDVSKSYVNEDVVTNVLHSVNIEIKQGEFVVILGPSGGGKTTLMNIISGLDRATNGIVNVIDTNLINLNDDELTVFRRKNISYVFQQYGLLPNLTVKENIEIGDFLRKENVTSEWKDTKKSIKTKWKKIRKENGDSNHNDSSLEKLELLTSKENYEKNKENPSISIDEVLGMLDLLEQKDKFPSQLSGGQQQRVSIARAIIKNANLLFADEPTGAVDNSMSDKILDIFKILNNKYNKTIIIVTHNPEIANLATKVIHIKNGTIEYVEQKQPLRKTTINNNYSNYYLSNFWNYNANLDFYQYGSLCSPYLSTYLDYYYFFKI